eukprot:scaffold30124_cov17-Prasinocladus_malaysianus.AAC.1
MKLTRQPQMPPPKLAIENGGGAELEALLAAVRLHFSYVTEVVQDLINRPTPEPHSVLVRSHSTIIRMIFLPSY